MLGINDNLTFETLDEDVKPNKRSIKRSLFHQVPLIFFPSNLI